MKRRDTPRDAAGSAHTNLDRREFLAAAAAGSAAFVLGFWVPPKASAATIPGAVWYEAMRKLSSNSVFTDMASTTLMIATARHGASSTVVKALKDAWKQVGL